MLRETSGLSRPVLKWVSQVAASLGATLSATLIWSVVPHPGGAPAAQATVQPEMTTGGKFAARAVQPVAYDGLDTMPLPHLPPAPARFVAVSFEPAPAAASIAASSVAPHRLAGAGEEAPAAERRAARSPRPLARAEARRPEPAPPAAIVTAAAPVAAAPEPAPEEGFLHRVIPSSLPSVIPAIVPTIASTARDAWTATASAGDALVAHVVPRMP